MNYYLIILGILIVLLIVFLYYFVYTTNNKVLSVQANLKVSNPAITSINNPTSRRYAYGIWIYVNSWDNTRDKTIFTRENNITLKLAATSPTLICSIITDNPTTPSIETPITDNFPLQKWVFVVLSIDNQFLDCYLDGKLVRSSKIQTQLTGNNTNGAMTTYIPKTPSESTPVQLGTNVDIVIASFTRWSAPVDPQTVWSEYAKGNNNSFMSRFTNMKSYGANISILQNNMEYSKINLF
jgi:hypothetical protein